ncbi:MAG TPA: T9SS type A sorting domain-containing protein, partial [Bacteroidales bacterium]|nr:T9SS type A sorting domain-containing protein [Bacteroidales bacterium]
VNTGAQTLSNVPLASDYIATGTTGLPQHNVLSHKVMPNPFSSNAILQLNLPTEGRLRLNIYNYLGQQIVQLADGNYQAGYVQFEINQSDLPGNGAYFYAVELETSTGLMRSRGNILLIR